MRYRICRRFTVENGHTLSKHPDKCRFPHGHSRTIEVVLSANTLDGNDMVCDFTALKLAVQDFLQRFDHAICVNADDPLLPSLRKTFPERLLVYEKKDPTTEVIAKEILEYLNRCIAGGLKVTDAETGYSYAISKKVAVERIRVWETAMSWAEYGKS